MNNIAPITDTESLIARAIDAGAGVDTLTSLYELRQRIDADEARREYFKALSSFQATCPEIKRTKKAGNFKYAPLDSIIKQLAGHTERFGFSLRFDEEAAPDGKTVHCIVTHIGGHSETSTVFVPTYVGMKTNLAQDAGGASTYGRRYAFSNAFGLVIDDDGDGAGAGPDNLSRVIGMVKELREYWDEVSVLVAFFDNGSATLEEAATAYAQLTKGALMALNLAPSYGGIFTTDERAFLKSDREFHEAVTEARNAMAPPWHERPENQL